MRCPQSILALVRPRRDDAVMGIRIGTVAALFAAAALLVSPAASDDITETAEAYNKGDYKRAVKLARPLAKKGFADI